MKRKSNPKILYSGDIVTLDGSRLYSGWMWGTVKFKLLSKERDGWWMETTSTLSEPSKYWFQEDKINI